MADEQKNLSGQVNALATRVAQEIKTLKGQSVDTSTLVPKVGDRGWTGGWSNEGFLDSYNNGGEPVDILCAGSRDFISVNLSGSLWATQRINPRAPTAKDAFNDTNLLGDNIAWVKTLRIQAESDASFAAGFTNEFSWVTGEAPTVEAGDVIVVLWSGNHGYLNILKRNPS